MAQKTMKKFMVLLAAAMFGATASAQTREPQAPAEGTYELVITYETPRGTAVIQHEYKTLDKCLRAKVKIVDKLTDHEKFLGVSGREVLSDTCTEK